ncbi:MAG TPA: efflux RND transporter periplasmic adaptor subunit [Candidatus Woesebacteria bacterium]|nr:efflux RND transporter periplasmic adaptor subunit [Candidatus Woesebacteria bacterium]
MKKFLTFLKKKISGFFHWFKKASLKKKIFIIILVIIIVVIIASQFRNDKPDYNTAQVKRADITQIVDESGVIKISSQTEIYSPTNGIIEDIYIKNGDQVTTGQDLFKVQSTATQQEQQTAYANYLTALNSLNAAKSNLNLLQADMFAKWDTFKELAESDYYENDDGTPKYEQRALPEFHIPEKEWLAAEQKYKDQQQVIAQAQAQVTASWLTYQATQTAIVKSTADGTISNLSVVLKDSVSANTGIAMTSETIKPVLTVADYTVIGVSLSLNESDINKVHAGDTATIDVDPIDNKKYKGVVMNVDEIGHDDKGITKYNVFVQIQDRNNQLKAGMTADVEIVTEKMNNVLSVPNAAIKPYEGGRAVQVLNKKNEVEFIPVQIGIRGETRTQIIKGIAEGQEIIISLTNDQVKQSGLFGSQ